MVDRRVTRLSRDPLRSTQNVLREGIVEVGYGEPDPRLLPVDLVAAAAAEVVGQFGPGAICYG